MEDKKNDKLFYVTVILTLVITVACIVGSIITEAMNLTLDDILSFVSPLGYANEKAEEIKGVFEKDNYTMKTYDTDGIVTEISDNTITLITKDNETKTYSLAGVDLCGNKISNILSDRVKIGDMLCIDYNGVSDSAYLYFRDGTMLQYHLLLNGYVKISNDCNSKYRTEFQPYEDRAKQDKVGIWE